MVEKKVTIKKKAKARERAESKPTFPYTTKPASLRKLLQQIPKKPKPPKIDKGLLASWGYKDGNDYSMVRVLKAVDLLSDSNEPTEIYAQYMNLQGGATALAAPIRKIYEPLFHASHEPYNESPETLQNLFHINSGGSERSLEQQIQTFKALCENTSFDVSAQTETQITGASQTSANPINPALQGSAGVNPSVNINLHIHLPENKSRRDYEAIIEDIGRYIFGREDKGSGNES